jgi:valyl-tRNA synthetase
MSKSKGNVLDPIDLIDGIELKALLDKRTTGMMQPHLKDKISKQTKKEFPDGIPAFGTDALRFTMTALASTGRDINFDLGRTEGYRNFCNKLWNAARYVLMNTENQDCGMQGEIELSLPDRWIRARLGEALAETHKGFANYRLDLSAQASYEFTWHQFCDWYLELSKPVLQSESTTEAQRRGTRQTLVLVLEASLRMLHPVMPFITEEIWQRVAPLAGKTGASIMLQDYPSTEEFQDDEEARAQMEWVMQFVLGVRQIRGEMDISPSRPLPLLLQDASDVDQRLWESHGAYLQSLARLESVDFIEAGVEAPVSATALLGDMKLLVPMAGLIDVAAERARLEKQLQRGKADLEKCDSKLSDQRFMSNAPAQVVEKERQRAEQLRQELGHLENRLATLANIGG